VPLICPTTQVEYFSREGWTTKISLIWLTKLIFARNHFSTDSGCAGDPNPRNRASRSSNKIGEATCQLRQQTFGSFHVGGNWGYAQFNYDAASDTFAPEGSGTDCGSVPRDRAVQRLRVHGIREEVS